MHQRTWLSLLTLPLIVAFTVPLFYQQAPRVARAASGAVSVDDPLAGLADIQDVLMHIKTYYVDVPDMEKVLAGGIQGALERVNLLNSYLTHEETQLPDPGPGETGLTLLKDRILAIVIGVAPDSPAAAAGFQVGDRIRRLDGESFESMSHWAMERRLRGPVGSEVALVRMPEGSSELKRIVLKRERLKRPAIKSSIDSKAIMATLPDLLEGRARELSNLFKTVDTALPLVLDLRRCIGGSYEEAAKVASLLGCEGLFATLQETGQPDRQQNIAPSETVNFSKIAVLTGWGTVGPSELLAVAVRSLGEQASGTSKNAAKTVISLGDRTTGQAVERRRIQLKHGGAVELVTRRWIGPGGERLDKAGPMPDYSLRRIPATENILLWILEALEKGPVKPKERTRNVALRQDQSLPLVLA